METKTTLKELVTKYVENAAFKAAAEYYNKDNIPTKEELEYLNKFGLNFTEFAAHYEVVTLDAPDGEINIEEEKALHERVKRHISELRLQTMKGELHKAEDVEKVMTDMLTSFKTRVMNIPSKVAPVLESRDAGFIKDRLTAEVTEALNELKDYDPKAFYSDEYVEGEDDD